MQIPNTWDDVEQPSDDKTAGNTWFWITTYREFHSGLKLALEELKSYSELAAELQLKSSPYQSEVDRLQQMIDWGEERLKSAGTSTLTEITLQGVTYGSLRYLKAGILLRAQKTAEKKEGLVHSHRFVPKTILQTFDEKIAQLLNLAEQGLLKGLRPAELLFESVSDDANEKMVPEARIQSSVTKVA